MLGSEPVGLPAPYWRKRRAVLGCTSLATIDAVQEPGTACSNLTPGYVIRKSVGWQPGGPGAILIGNHSTVECSYRESIKPPEMWPSGNLVRRLGLEKRTVRLAISGLPGQTAVATARLVLRRQVAADLALLRSRGHDLARQRPCFCPRHRSNSRSHSSLGRVSLRPALLAVKIAERQFAPRRLSAQLARQFTGVRCLERCNPRLIIDLPVVLLRRVGPRRLLLQQLACLQKRQMKPAAAVNAGLLVARGAADPRSGRLKCGTATIGGVFVGRHHRSAHDQPTPCSARGEPGGGEGPRGEIVQSPPEGQAGLAQAPGAMLGHMVLDGAPGQHGEQ